MAENEFEKKVFRVGILEPFLRDKIGHYFSFVKELQLGFRSLGDEVSVYIPKDANVSLDGDRILPSQYDIDENYPYWKRVFKVFGKILVYRRVLSKISKRFDLLIITTANSFQILSSLGMAKISCPVFLYFHTLDLMKSKMGFFCRFFFKVFPKKVSLMGLMAPFNFVEKEVWDKIAKIPIKIFPNSPYPISLITNPQKVGDSETERFTIGYFGDARVDKNFPTVSEFALKKYKQYSFIIQCHPPATGKLEPEVIDGIKNLKSISGKEIILLETPLNLEEYFSYLNRVSIILCLHDPEAFNRRLSSVLLEALCAGKPVLVLEGTWLAEQVKKHGGGVVVSDLQIQTLENAVEYIRANFKKFQSEAYKAGGTLLEYHNGRSLAEFIKRKFLEFFKEKR